MNITLHQARAEGGGGGGGFGEGAWAPAPLPKVPFCQGNFYLFIIIKHPSVKACPI